MTGFRHAPQHKSAFDSDFTAIRGTGPGIDRAQAKTEEADRNMRRALFRYGSRYGLPNMSRLQCIEELRTLDRSLEEDLALADRLEAEMRRPVPRRYDW